MSPPRVPVAALVGIEPVRRGTSLASRADARSLLPQVVPGQVLSARVDAILHEGYFRVAVAEQPLAMALPKYFAPGDTLELVFVAREPRLTFALSEAGQLSPAAVVSAAGRLVASVLPQPGEAAMPSTMAAPLLVAAAEDGAALSTELQGKLSQSGLFYESHQAEWIEGKRELALLLREPQAQLVSSVKQQGARAPQTAALAAAPDAVIAIAPADDLTSAAAIAPSEQRLPQQVQALVQQQLAALETGKLAFQLQVWSGQWMQWEIDADAHYGGAQPGDTPRPLQTRLRLDLPKLGELEATLSFDAAGVRVRLDAAKASSANVLQDNRASLHAALAQAGLRAVEIAVARHGPV